ncbi:sodium/glutamate symporter family protein [Acidaminobacter hydrogenoformans]|uniref:Glutamate:Na+ symporter, ESS family n=1 Tax=Acidaminobacter hydrogenoformans DSM 2784 TaxID=1120920 RepID=A0A1G5S3B5_9FIRM|nr:sodium/glutamate symporter [Acidaminobacter hydrogenoformans]SCZ80865.1 glutamate:Na+ symporter, ESS family [Acidaminobacter hydrogenoformans DSM 2784]
MTNALFQELLFSLAFLSVFLLLGTFLRAKVKWFQKTFMPASVIGGFIALILGPIGLKLIPVPESWMAIFSLLPGILIVPIVASVPLGLSLGSKGGKGSGGADSKDIVPMFLILTFIVGIQYMAGFIIHVIFKGGGMDLYETFGWELTMGFSGGHGTAGLLGNMLKGMNIPYWETAQGVGVTTATIGILGGILGGIALINWAARTGRTNILDKPGSIPQHIQVGYQTDVNKQASIGRETTNSSSIDTFAFHSAIILAACGLAYLILHYLKLYKVPVLSNISVWGYSIIVMFGVWNAMVKLKIDYLVDSKVKSKISGSLTEIAVVAAIASLPLKAILAYITPIIAMSILGLIVTFVSAIYLSKKYLSEYRFEHAIAAIGTSTGVFLTGLLLLRICDPEFESPVLGNYSIAYTFNSVLGFALMQFYVGIMLTKGAMNVIIASGIQVLICLVGLVIYNKIKRSVKGEVAEAN